MEYDVRWQQRFQNFSDALAQPQEAVETIENPSDLEIEGTIQRFEFTHELSWKGMKDILEWKGIKGIIGSKDAVRHAFQNGIITNGQYWMDMIESRNRTVHTYMPEILSEEYSKIVTIYFPLLSKFNQKMSEHL